MAAPHKKSIFKPIEIKNPFDESADKAYSEILLDKMQEAQTWRKFSIVSLLFFLISLILFFYSSSRQQTVPVLVNVMPSGESQYLGEVRQQGTAQVPDAAIHFQIRSFISNLRSVSTDYQVVYDNIDACFQMSMTTYQPILREMLTKDSPFAQVGKIRRTVEIESLLHITGRSYQVNWFESTIDMGADQRNYKMRAVVTIRLVTPTETTIKRNPLGIYIENMEMVEL